MIYHLLRRESLYSCNSQDKNADIRSHLLEAEEGTWFTPAEPAVLHSAPCYLFFYTAGVMEDPIFVACCESLVGCRSCTTLWLQNSSLCLKCRADDFSVNIHRVTGLSEVVNTIRELARQEQIYLLFSVMSHD